MEKKKSILLKGVRYLSVLSVIIIGLMSIIATGGGEGGVSLDGTTVTGTGSGGTSDGSSNGDGTGILALA